ncbi:hypothetical protein AOLI_G00045590 [Acnodon oligacanthus]
MYPAQERVTETYPWSQAWGWHSLAPGDRAAHVTRPEAIVSSETKLLDRGWSLSYSGVAQRERCRAGVVILTSTWLVAVLLEFVPVDKRVASIRIKITERKTLTVVCAYAPNNRSEYLAFLE